MVALTVLAWAVLAIALLVAVLLASMLRVGARVDGGELWAWAGIGPVEAEVALPQRTLTVRVVGLRVARRPLGRSERAPEREDAAAQRQRRARVGDWSPGSLLGLRRRLGAYRAILRRLVGRVRVDACEGHLRIATHDPSATGVVYGLAEGARALLPTRHRQRLTLTPDFVGDVPGGRAVLALRVRVAALAWAAWRVYWFERGRARRGRRRPATPGGSGHEAHRTARGARGAGA